MGDTLYTITGQFKALYEMAKDGDVDEEVFAGTLESLQGDYKAKANGCAFVVGQLKMEAEEAKKRAEIWDARYRTIESRWKRIEESIQTSMIELGIKEIKTEEFTIKLQNNGGVQPLEVTGEVPEKFLKVVYEKDNKKIREYLMSLKDGETCEWAHLKERGKHISIK